jgi:hypothetical protein
MYKRECIILKREERFPSALATSKGYKLPTLIQPGHCSSAGSQLAKFLNYSKYSKDTNVNTGHENIYSLSNQS